MENSLAIGLKPNLNTNNDLMQLLVSFQLAQMSQQHHLQQQQQQNQTSNSTLRNLISLYLEQIQMINALNSASNREFLNNNNNNLINNSSSNNGRLHNDLGEFDDNFNSNRKLTLKKEKSNNESEFNYSHFASGTSLNSFKKHDNNEQTKASKDEQFVPYKKRRFNVACDDERTSSSYSSECAVNQEELINSIKQLAPEHQHKKSNNFYLNLKQIEVVGYVYF